jgi:hypothetical protein
VKTGSLSDLKKELKTLPHEELLEHCLRLAKHKKENKELLSYLLFEAHDEQQFIKQAKEESEQLFSEINRSNIYYAKKSLRKILRLLNKYAKFSGQKQTEAELLIWFCRKLKSSGIPIKRHQVLQNLYERQRAKIEKAIASMHEDLQYDYRKEMEGL